MKIKNKKKLTWCKKLVLFAERFSSEQSGITISEVWPKLRPIFGCTEKLFFERHALKFCSRTLESMCKIGEIIVRLQAVGLQFY